MALTPQTVEVRFRERDGKQSSKLAAQGTVTRAENVTMSKPGAYARRTGTEAVETVSGAKELVPYSSALVTLSDTVLKQRISGAFTAPAASDLRWTTVSATRSIETGSDQVGHSHVRGADGRDWHVWEAYEGGVHKVKYSVIDPTSGARIVHDALVDSGASRPYIIAVGTDILIFYVEGAETSNGVAASLIARKIAQATPASVGSAVTVESGVLQIPGTGPDTFYGPFTYDVTVNGSTVVVCSVVTGSDTRVRTWNPTTMASVASVTEVGAYATRGTDVIGFLNHDFSDSNYYMARAYVDNSTGVRTLLLQVVPTNLASVTNYTLKTESGDVGVSTRAWQNVTGYVDVSLTAHVLAEVVNHVNVAADDASAAIKWHYYATRTSGGSISATTRAGLGVASRPWVFGSDRYVLMSHTSYAQPTYFVTDPSTGTIYGRVLPGSAGLLDNEKVAFNADPSDRTLPQRPGRLPAPAGSGTNVTIAVSKLREAPPFVIEGSTYRGGASRGAWTVSIAPWTAGGEFQPQISSDALLITGGAPRIFDGGSIVESGFHLFPEKPPANSTSDLPDLGTGNELSAWTPAAGSLTDGTYYVQLIWEWTDSRARVHRSAPSLPFAMVVSGVTGYSIRVMSPLTSRAGTRLVAFRTLVNAGVDAAYFRASEVLASPLSGGSLYTSIVLSDSDANVQTREQLYTDDETLDNAPAFSMRQAKTWKDRVMFLLEENRRAFGWSKLVKPDLGLEWSDSFIFEVADEFGELTALSPLGSNFLFFKRDAIYWISGAGPDDTGAGQFSEPIRLDGVPGTERPRSVTVTKDGVWYQAPDNVIWLISPSLDAKPIGEPCADQTAAIVGAMHVPDKRQVRFHTASTTLVYDTLHGVWTTFTGQASLACCMLGADAHYLSTGAVVRKDNTSYTEAGTTYQAVLELSWLSIAGLAGYQRVWSGDVVGEAAGAYTLSVVMTADFGTGTATKTLASSGLSAAVGHRLRFYVPMSLQQKTALRLKLQDDSPSTAGGLWEGINLQCGFAPGRRPQLPSTHRMA